MSFQLNPLFTIENRAHTHTHKSVFIGSHRVGELTKFRSSGHDRKNTYVIAFTIFPLVPGKSTVARILHPIFFHKFYTNSVAETTLGGDPFNHCAHTHTHTSVITDFKGETWT